MWRNFLVLLVWVLAGVAHAQTGLVNGKGVGITDKKAFNEALGTNYLDVTNFGAVGDAVYVNNAVVSGSSLTASGVNFTASVGKYILVHGAGVAGADLATTIATGANGSCTLTVAASTAIGSNGTAVFGTNNSTFIQNAINAAALGTGPTTVQIPSGGFIANFTTYSNVRIVGAGASQMRGDFPTPAQIADRAAMPTVLFPAVRTLPAVAFDRVYGASIHDLSIVGKSALGGVGATGTGIEIGPDTGSGYWGHGCDNRNIAIFGFEYAITCRSVSFSIDSLLINNCANGVWIGAKAGGSDGGAKVTTVNYKSHYTNYPYNAHASLATLACIYAQSCDWNSVVSVANLREDFTFIGRNINWEANSGDAFNLYGARSSLDVFLLHHLNTPPAAAVANYGTTDKISIGGCASSQGLIYKTAGSEVPHLLDRSMYIDRYTSTAWTTLNEREYASVVYRNERSRDRDWEIKEEFFRSPNTSPYGELGWTWAKFAGSADPSSIGAHSNPINGLLRFQAAASASNAYRFSPENVTGAYGWSSWPTVSNLYFEQTWVFSNAQPATTVMRLGMFSYGTTLPTTGFGIRVDRSLGTPDANVQFIVVSGSTEYPVSTGVAYTAINPTNSHVMVTMKKIPGGGFTCILRDFLTRVPLAPEVTNSQSLDSSNWGPAAYIGTTGAAAIDLRIDRMTWRQHFPN